MFGFLRRKSKYKVLRISQQGDQGSPNYYFISKKATVQVFPAGDGVMWAIVNGPKEVLRFDKVTCITLL
jgi:hypothetical protein